VASSAGRLQVTTSFTHKVPCKQGDTPSPQLRVYVCSGGSGVKQARMLSMTGLLGMLSGPLPGMGFA